MFNFSKSKYINFAKLHQEIDNMIGRIPAVSRRRKLKRVFRILKYFCLAALLLILISLAVFSAEILRFKRVYSKAFSGKENLELAVTLSRRRDFSQAAANALTALADFDSSIEELGRIKNNYPVKRFSWLMSQFNDIENLLVTARFLGKAVGGGANFSQNLQAILENQGKLNFLQLETEDRRELLTKIFEAAPELNGIKANLDLAYLNLEQVRAGGLLFPLKNEISGVKRQISQARLALKKAVPLSQLIPALAGYPEEAVFLVILQNNDELRPTGGFIGTYGILRIKNGKIINFKTDDIYHLDMPARDKVQLEPPAPIKKYLIDKWYMRDANWSPDWPTSARKISWFYRLESEYSGEAEKNIEFSGVIALTPELVTDFLALTGPVAVKGEVYNQDNFQELLQYRVEQGYQLLGVPKWQRKDVIGEIAKELQVKIFEQVAFEWPNMVNILIDNLTAKNLLLYLADSQLENIAAENGWGGEIKDQPGDYLMVIDANMGALKTDAVINRGFEYRVSRGINGFFSKLSLNYAHNGKPDWKTSVYKSYTRVYVPLGSQLIGLSGYQSEQIDIGSEAGKTWFGFYLVVDPGKIKNLILEYKPPASVLANNSYSLYLQKQPGKEIGQAKIDLSFGNDIKSYSPVSLSTRKVSPTELSWQGDLSIDRSFEAKF